MGSEGSGAPQLELRPRITPDVHIYWHKRLLSSQFTAKSASELVQNLDIGFAFKKKKIPRTLLAAPWMFEDRSGVRDRWGRVRRQDEREEAHPRKPPQIATSQ